MDVMEKMSSVGAGTPSVIDRRPIAVSLDRLAELLGRIAPGRLLIIAGDEVHTSEASAEVTVLEFRWRVTARRFTRPRRYGPPPMRSFP